ncbi:hypothetical protein SD37_24530 [Amycolatopsis orientalis]|uniref:DUF2613 domain-containing protein n=1 Tax=Amycolatopsis orientalis TaxID=31958 RepID=A0A193C249_AMYOR|nr:DUF2613 family protein [Amycolatopsis orientalis]ANN18478.1 hypothetical protein SD37_24530 [Amycolatopsis orientalis]
MGTLIGAAAAVIIGLATAAGGSYALTNSADPDAAPQVQAKIKEQYNPLVAPENVIYGKR